MTPYITKNGIKFSFILTPEGGRFFLYKENKTTKKQISQAKKELRSKRDVISFDILPYEEMDTEW